MFIKYGSTYCNKGPMNILNGTKLIGWIEIIDDQFDIKLKCLGFTYNGAKLFNMLPIKMKKVEDPNTFKTMTKDWIWENIPSY